MEFRGRSARSASDRNFEDSEISYLDVNICTYICGPSLHPCPVSLSVAQSYNSLRYLVLTCRLLILIKHFFYLRLSLLCMLVCSNRFLKSKGNRICSHLTCERHSFPLVQPRRLALLFRQKSSSGCFSLVCSCAISL